jgi:hypothetical protein
MDHKMQSIDTTFLSNIHIIPHKLLPSRACFHLYEQNKYQNKINSLMKYDKIKTIKNVH